MSKIGYLYSTANSNIANLDLMDHQLEGDLDTLEVLKTNC